MNRKKAGAGIAAAAALGLCFILCKQLFLSEAVPADDEIALHIQFDTSEDIGLLVYDYRADSHEYSGGISNADGSPIGRNSNLIVGLEKEKLDTSADVVELSVQFRIITEYVTPNYENIYPDDITKYTEPLSWEAHFGEAYFITITGDRTAGYKIKLHNS